MELRGKLNGFLAVVLAVSGVCGAVGASISHAADDENDKTSEGKPAVDCETAVKPKRTTKKVEPAAAVATKAPWTLYSFLDKNPETNLALQHPFTIANAAEKAYALITHIPAREALDPLYHVKPVKVYPMLAGEHPATEGRMVVGQEDSLSSFVSFIHSKARGDRSGKALGFPGPPGTGKTELLYVVAALAKNLGKEDKYKELTYRWKGLYNIPYFRPLFKFLDGKPMTEYFDPDLKRSPFTLLRADMQKAVLDQARPAIRAKWDITVSEGWSAPEPKSAKIIQMIFEHEIPGIADGQRTIEDLSPEEYLATLQKYLVIVPKVYPKEPQIIRAQTDNPNYQALFTSPNIARANSYDGGFQNPLAVDYTGKVVQQDGGLSMYDELFRNPGELLNIFLEVFQNNIAETDFGGGLKMDTLPIWNSNDESIEKSGEDNAIKALINRTDSPAMRSLLPVNQIEAVMPFQIGIDRFKMRKLDETQAKPFVHSEVYPAVDSQGRTYSAHGRYALYYDMDGHDILIAPYTLNYMAWLASATRFVTDASRIAQFGSELNLVRSNPGLFTNPIDRVKINLGDKHPEMADLMELSKVRYLVREGEAGITARDMETWLKESLEMTLNKGASAMTPSIVDQAFQKLLDEGRVKPGKVDVRARWQLIRQNVKLELLLPKLDQEVKSIVSGDGQRAERIYDQVEQEFIADATTPNAREVVPEDGSQRILINRERLNQIRKIYRTKFGREFSATFLLRHLGGARRSAQQRDSDLLESVRIFIAGHEAAIADYVSAFDSLYRGQTQDPNVIKRAADVEPLLSSYGYDLSSFKEAISFMAQLQRAEQMRNQPADR